MDTHTGRHISPQSIPRIILFIVAIVLVGCTWQADATNNTTASNLSAEKSVQNSSVTEVLKLIARGQAPKGTKFAIKHSRRAGTPLLWEEVISIELDGNMHYSTLRSFVDAGGSPIGFWAGASDPGTVQALAETLLQVKFRDIPSTPIMPGGEANSWEVMIQDEKIVITTGDDPDIMMELSPVDVLLRRTANQLVSSHNGAALKLQLFTEIKGKTATVQVAFINDGDKDLQIQNPLIQADHDKTFLQIEIGVPPVEVAGITGADIKYQPLSLPSIKNPPAPWDKPYIALKAGEQIVCPLQLPIDLPTHLGHFIKATYANYAPNENSTASSSLPLIRGQVFSLENKLK